MQQNDIDITELVEFGNADDEVLPLIKCACGKRFTPWDFILSIYRDMADECPSCGRKMYFSFSVRVWEVSSGKGEMKAL